jgi:hypothetical protein
MVFGVSAVPNLPPASGAQFPEAQGACQYCRQPIRGPYYRIRSAMSCPACSEKIRAAIAKNKANAYPFALVCGVGAAFLGMFLNAAFFISTGWIVSLPALAVGWMVGMAISKGAGGAGGRSYQITAAVLTYVAISMSSLPVGMHYARQREQAAWRARTQAFYRNSVRPGTTLTPEQKLAREQDLAARQRALEDEFSQAHATRRPFQRSFPPPYLPSSPTNPPAGQSTPKPPDAAAAVTKPVPQVRMIQPRLEEGVPPQIVGNRVPQAATPGFTFWGFLGQFLGLTIASPFAFFWVQGLTLETALNFLLLIIGMVFAWRLTSGVEFVIFGPFETASIANPLK